MGHMERVPGLNGMKKTSLLSSVARDKMPHCPLSAASHQDSRHLLALLTWRAEKFKKRQSAVHY